MGSSVRTSEHGENMNMTKFEIQNCKLLQGDFRETLDGIRGVDLFFTSPPYNIGSKCPKRLTNRRCGGYDAKSWGSIEGYDDSLPEEEYQKQQKAFLEWCERRLSPNGVIIYNHKPRHKSGNLVKPERWILPLEDEKKLVFWDEIIWDRGSTHNHCKSYVYQQSERLYVLCRPGAKPYFQNEDFYWKPRNGGVGDVWRITPDYSNPHNAPFPVHLAVQCIRMWSRPGGLVCDPHSGSGTTMLA
jgi:DNA modification methylase